MTTPHCPFAINIPDDVLSDLRDRLARTRYPEPTPGQRWAAGTDPDYLRELVEYWRHGFDWRAQEAELNALTHRIAVIDGKRLHYVHARAQRAPGAPAPLPLILSHGWPSSFVEMLPLVPLLTDPAAHGADPADAFDLVIPSLAGHLYSEVPHGPATRPVIADSWARLMTELGYDRFGLHGGDIGGGVNHWLAINHPDRVIGLHTIHPKLPDSPSGLAAWIVEKYRAWSDCHGDIESRYSKDLLLTILTLYWATGCIGTSFRTYYDYPHNTTAPLIHVPVAVTASTEDYDYPRELAERSYTDIRQWRDADKGGHFMPLEEPDLLARQLRAFFHPLHES